MKKFMLVLLLFICLGCSKDDNMQDVPYIVTEGYYVNNSTPILKEFAIYTAYDWGMFVSNYYPALCVPRYIDFSKDFVIAVQQKVIDEVQQIEPVSLKYGNGSLHFTYTIKRGEKLTDNKTVPGPAIMLVVSRNYASEKIIFNQNVK